MRTECCDETASVICRDCPRTRLTINFPDDMNAITKRSVVYFAEALAKKLRQAEIKYGYSNGWTYPDWEDKCRKELMDHLAKGDPRDVAIYAMFMWHHGWSTSR